MKINPNISPADLRTKLNTLWDLSGQKIIAIEKSTDPGKGSPVFTANGKYTTLGWTEWTQGFQYGSPLLQYDATGDTTFLDIGRNKTLEVMAPHVSHIGVHDHGFNNVSTYGNLLRLLKEEKIEYNEWEKSFYELALKISGAIQASRWTKIKDGGFIYSFNGPHSLFIDTIRSCRVLAISHVLGHFLQEENDKRVNLLERMIKHAKVTAEYSVYYGEERDMYDVPGRTAHGREKIESFLLKAARATCDFFIKNTSADGIPYWDTGAPNLQKLGDYLNQPADPNNEFEPVDSSAAAIGAQGLLRLGHYLEKKGESESGEYYWQAGLTILEALFDKPYLSKNPNHQGLILHSIYHHPNGWDFVPEGSKIPNGESSMWGDYHAREVALYLQKIINNEPYYTFFNCVK